MLTTTAPRLQSPCTDLLHHKHNHHTSCRPSHGEAHRASNVKLSDIRQETARRQPQFCQPVPSCGEVALKIRQHSPVHGRNASRRSCDCTQRRETAEKRPNFTLTFSYDFCSQPFPTAGHTAELKRHTCHRLLQTYAAYCAKQQTTLKPRCESPQRRDYTHNDTLFCYISTNFVRPHHFPTVRHTRQSLRR